MARGLSKPDITTRALIFAALCRMTLDGQKTDEMNRKLCGIVTELSIRLDDNFSLSNEQKVFFFIIILVPTLNQIMQANVRIIAGDLLYDTNRIVFKHLHIDVDVSLSISFR
jgi:hypothetical protein